MTPAKSAAIRRQEIRRFLMARRAAISPDSVGLPGGSRRRTPGLRREEVASLAGVGVTWYTWFEQGRDIQVSARVLERIAQAIRLTPSDTDYLYSLSGVPRSQLARGSAEKIDQYIQEILDGFEAGPGMFVSPCFDVLAYNRLADRVFEFKDCSGPFARNHIWRLFMDPKRRAMYLDWEFLAELSVGSMRTAQGQMPDDDHFNSLIRDLCDGSQEFRRLWDAHLTAPQIGSLKFGMKLPRFGALHFTSERFRSLESQQLLIFLLPADEKSVSAMRELAKTARKKTSRKR